MKSLILSAAPCLALGAPALAAGDVAKGEKSFAKCRSCHSITAPDGTNIVKGGKVGPNLYGVVGRVAGSTDFAYGASLKKLGEGGFVWDEASIVDYIADPTAFLKKQESDPAAHGKMTFKLAKGGEDIVAYLQSVVTQ